MNRLLVDIGNTHIHYAILKGEANWPVEPQNLPTQKLLAGEFPPSWETAGESLHSIVFCSVVPRAKTPMMAFHQNHAPQADFLELGPDTLPGLPLAYPSPREIGPDRLANAVSAFYDFPLPAVVIDMGTAVTFDIVTAQGGYEGGIIAPGVGLMTRYLHQQTALLPQLQEPLSFGNAIGKSTREAMSIGCVVGFRGSIRALLQEVADELTRRGERLRSLIFTGGTGFLFANKEEMNKTYQSLVPLGVSPMITHSPMLTLRGLEKTFLYHQSANNQ